ncbi:MAG: DUF72 domain-containing protein [Clostridia bacterium]|nr:DUF72 domain-containing protein [Clostridia bacterium]
MVLIGTSGYSYKDWIGPFYPEGTKDREMLDYYVHNFNFVEINSSYYHMPRLQLFESMDKKTPPDYQFAVKLFGGFTHERNLSQYEADKFKYSIRPLTENGKLTCLLAQFPYSFHCNRDNVDYLKRIREWFGDMEVNVEFRNQKWIRQETIEFLKKEKLGFVAVDEPSIRGLIKQVTAVTSKVSYLRLHGRNAEKWYGGEGSERYDYLYSEDELEEWLPRIRELEQNAPVTVIAFNNHPRGKAVTNAKELAALLL